MPLTQQQLVTRVNEIMCQLFELEASDLKPEAGLFTDLELDSLDAIDLVISFQREFKINPDNAELQQIRTLQNVYDLVFKYYDLHAKSGA